MKYLTEQNGEEEADADVKDEADGAGGTDTEQGDQDEEEDDEEEDEEPAGYGHCCKFGWPHALGLICSDMSQLQCVIDD